MDLRIFQEYAQQDDKELTTELIQFIQQGIKHPIIRGHIIEAYNRCVKYCKTKFLINEVKASDGTIIKYY